MAKFKNQYRSESMRWKWWNYSAPGSYFITICTHDKKHSLGFIRHQKTILSDLGQTVEREFILMPTYHPRIILDAWVIMPNHIHFLITLRDYDFDNQMCDIEKFNPTNKNHAFTLPLIDREQSTLEQIKAYRKLRRNMIIPKVIGKFKMLTSKRMNLITGNKNPNWQADYYDVVVRNNQSFNRILHYIYLNPRNWNSDKLNNKS